MKMVCSRNRKSPRQILPCMRTHTEIMARAKELLAEAVELNKQALEKNEEANRLLDSLCKP